MKKHISIKKIKNDYKKVFRTGYADLQDIMKNTEADYYNAGVYGWNCDIYVNFAYDIAITTGYRNMAGVMIPDELIKKYSENARKIAKETVTYSETCEKLHDNRMEFFKELSNM